MDDQKERRSFNSSERVALWLIEGGACALCGAKLDRTWEPDHVVPYAKRGATDVVNGQALCRSCNRKKGANVTKAVKLPEDFEPYKWQRDALEEWETYIQEEDPQMFLLAATPAAGKTKWALWVAYNALDKGWIERVVVVGFTSGMTEQWADEAAKFNIELDPDWKNAFGEEHEENDKQWHGLSITYHSAANAPELQRALCSRAKTMVIFDEVHHCGDNKSWGKQIRRAFDDAVIRIGLSGTPFRADGAIPWVEYPNGVSKLHFEYSHGAALRDGANIPVAFPSYDGFTEWSEDGKTFSAWLSDDEATLKQRARRRNIAIDPEFDWVGRVIQDADEKITECRSSGDPKAALIIFCKKQVHAQELAAKYTEITGYDAVVVTSDVPKSREKIDAFTKGAQRCLVCVEMVSEGIDIPRLRAAIYATNKRESLGFLQKVGRVVRVNRDISSDVVQLAYFYIPREMDLIKKAESIKDMRDHILQEEPEDTTDGPNDDDDDDKDPPPSTWEGISASGIHDDLIYDGEQIRQACYARAQVMCKENEDLRDSVSDAAVALVLECLAKEGRLPEVTLEPPALTNKSSTNGNGSATNKQAKYRRNRTVTQELDRETKGLVTERLNRQGFKKSDPEWAELYQVEIRDLRYELGDAVKAWGKDRSEEHKRQQFELAKKWRKQERNA